MMKAKKLFEIVYSMDELTREEFVSIIWSNQVDDGFIGAMCALMDYVDLMYENNKIIL